MSLYLFIKMFLVDYSYRSFKVHGGFYNVDEFSGAFMHDKFLTNCRNLLALGPLE